METEHLTLRLHYSGHFLQNKYSGGSHKEFGIDPDWFSYSVLMEEVKDLKFDEIGGIYVSKGRNGGWKLVTDDSTLAEYMKGKSELDFYIDCTVDKAIPAMNQMQPHVIVRPRPSLLKPKEKNAEKRTFVTLKNINDEKKRKLKDMNNEKERRISTRKKLQFNQNDASPTREEPMSLSCYMHKFMEAGGSTETAGEGVVKEIEIKGCNEYEIRRNKNVAENKSKLEALGLGPSKSAKSLSKDKDKVINDDASESEYLPNNNDIEHERQSDDAVDNVTSKKSKKVKSRRVEIGAGPRTRSRANNLVTSSQKNEVVVGATSLPIEGNTAHVLSLKEKLKNLKDGPGSMTAYLELRKREKLQVEKEIPQAESQTQHLQSQSDTPVDEAPKRKRGKTKMAHVHNRIEKKVITLNYLSQPVADNGKLLSEFSCFLGTTVRQFVSLTCATWHEVPEKELLWEYIKDKYIIPEEAKKWVLKTMNDQFRSNKSRIKRDYYYPYSTDEDRLENRPPEVPLTDWKILLKYWGDEKIQETAKKNSEARKTIIETHTTGPTSFAQVANKMRLEKLEKMHVNGEEDEDGDCEEEPVIISDADLYIATRERKANREYKLPDEVYKTVKDKIANVKKALETEGVEAANKLVRGGKGHNPSYLIGRLIRKKESKSKSSATSSTSIPVPDQYISELTAKIRAQLQEEMDEKLDRKVQEMMKRLADKNPDLKVDIDSSPKSAEMSHGDDNVTP